MNYSSRWKEMLKKKDSDRKIFRRKQNKPLGVIFEANNVSDNGGKVFVFLDL